MKINLNIDRNIFNDVYYEHLENDRWNQIYFGGASSGKSFFLTQKIILDNLKGHNYLVVRKTNSSIKRSIFNEIVKAISFFKLTKYYEINKSFLIITNKLNQKQILFSGLDDVEKLKSISPKNGVLTRVFIEEATQITRADFKQLTKRLRGKTDLAKSIIMAFNPVSKYSWIYEDFFVGRWDESKTYYADDEISILKTTYKDNKFLTKQDINNLESESDAFWYDVYTLGNWGTVGKTIFNNWQIDDLSDFIPHFHNIKHGLDFGWNDPTAYVKLHLDKKNKIIYIFDEFYGSEIETPDLINIIKPKIGNSFVSADSASPRTINDLRAADILVLEAKKGQDSVMHGIRFLHEYKIIIHHTCKNTIREFTLYEWRKDKNGEPLELPEDKNNHCLAADTIVNTTDGDFKIKDLVGKTGKIHCYDEINKKQTISDFYDVRCTQKNVDVFEIETEDGRKFKATANHPILTKRGWIIAKNLTENDEIIDINII